MGWANCGTDSTGRNIGYAHEATCDHEGCSEKIDRGLSYACGDMHGENDGIDCEKYFCENHRQNYVIHIHGECRVCDACAKRLVECGDFVEDEEEGALVCKSNK